MQMIWQSRQRESCTRVLREEVLNCLVTGLAFLHGETSEQAQRLARRVLANIILEHLDISGFAVHRKEANETIES